MSERVFRQFFGPSSRHDRACVELSFPLDGATRRLAPLEPLLLEHRFKLRDLLPDGALPLGEAVARLASALLSRHASVWSHHGSEAGRGWAALAHPFPPAAAGALEISLALLSNGADASADAAAKLRTLADWLNGVSEIRTWMLSAANLLGHATARVNTTTELYQIGQGAKGLHFFRMGNERDAITGQMLENDKHTTIDTLRGLGLPTTRAAVVRSQDQVAKAVALVGLPCVVKPTTLSRGAGVATHLASEEHVAAAVAHALRLSPKPALIENHVEGQDYRLMVVGDELLWAYRRTPASVVGDGEATMRELVERENLRRAAIRDGSDAYLYKIPAGNELERFVASRYGFRADEVLPKGKRIDAAGQANIARGGVLEDVTGIVHPDNRAMAIRVSRLFRVRTMGLDYLTPDISRSWKEVASAIVEVNRTPAIWGLGDAALVQRTLFPNRLSGAIPAIAVIGDGDYRGALAEELCAAFARHGLRLATANYSRAPEKGMSRSTLPRGVEVLTIDPEADAAAVLCSPDRVEAAGLPMRRCDLLLVQNRPAPWLAAAAQTMLVGEPSDAKIEQAVARLARRYKDPQEGGPLPVLEIAGTESDANFTLKVWRTRAMPLGWFRNQLGLEASDAAGLTTEADLLAAVRALADRALGGGALPAHFSHEELIGNWFRVTFDAEIALPAKQADTARAALLAAVERVNAVAAAKIA